MRGLGNELGDAKPNKPPTISIDELTKRTLFVGDTVHAHRSASDDGIPEARRPARARPPGGPTPKKKKRLGPFPPPPSTASSVHYRERPTIKHREPSSGLAVTWTPARIGN